MINQFTVKRSALNKVLLLSLIAYCWVLYHSRNIESHPQEMQSQNFVSIHKAASPSITKAVNRSQNKINHPIYTRSTLLKLD